MIKLLVSAVTACTQLNLLNIYNQGSITDYLTNQDEIQIKFGVGDYFVF